MRGRHSQFNDHVRDSLNHIVDRLIDLGTKVESNHDDAKACINEAEAALSDLRHRVSDLGEQRGREEVSSAKIGMKLEKLITGLFCDPMDDSSFVFLS